MPQLPPQLHAMLLCDRSFQQAQTGKWCVIGTQSALLAPQLPISYPLSVFVSVGDLRHGARFEVELRDPQQELLLQAEAEIQHQPGAERSVSGVDLGWQFPILKLDAYGMYRIQIKGAGQVLAERSLEVCEEPKQASAPTDVACELLALLLCDVAFQHHGTPSWSLIGIHNTILVPELPSAHTPFVVFWSLRHFRGEAIVMATVRDNEGSIVYAVRAQFPRIDAEVFEMAFPFPPVAFQRAGSHVIELQVGEELLAVKSFYVQARTGS